MAINVNIKIGVIVNKEHLSIEDTGHNESNESHSKEIEYVDFASHKSFVEYLFDLKEENSGKGLSSLMKSH